jgi:hypothetical protein
MRPKTFAAAAVIALALAGCGGGSSSSPPRPGFGTGAAASCRQAPVPPLPATAATGTLRRWARRARQPLRARFAALAATKPPARLQKADKLLLDAMNQELILVNTLTAGTSASGLAAEIERVERQQRRFAIAIGIPECGS